MSDMLNSEQRSAVRHCAERGHDWKQSMVYGENCGCCGWPSPEVPDARAVAGVFQRAHDEMRNGDGLQPQEALEELLKILFLLLHRERDAESSPERQEVHYRDGRTQQEPHASHAQRIRAALAAALQHQRDSGNHVPDLGEFRLSSRTLSRVVQELLSLRYSSLPLDLKSTALRVFLSSNLRRGLGIYLTPDPVVQMVVDVLEPRPGVAILDPACGTGSFLLHTLLRWLQSDPTLRRGGTPVELFGVERNSRILRIAEVNLVPLLGAGFRRKAADSLLHFDSAEYPSWFRSGSFDYVMTNPPFGVSVDGEQLRAAGFDTSRAENGGLPSRLGSEMVFVERCLDLLRPGGILAIVVPNSVISNVSYAGARRVVDGKGELLGGVSLPPETFATTGTQATTSVLFFRRRGASSTSRAGSSRAYYAAVRNVGYDGTGRARQGSELPQVVKEFRRFLANEPIADQDQTVGAVLALPDGRQLAALSETLMAGTGPAVAVQGGGLRLKDCATVIRTGRTPPRNSYSEDGHFIVKVGNLTNAGIDWFARDRNYVSTAYIEKLRRSRLAEEMFLRVNDIVLTSSAHSVNYIAKKVDIVDGFPSFVTQPNPYVGEVLLIRPNTEVIDPYFLLAYLRSDRAQRSLRAMIRGQTAHLMPNDASNLWVPDIGQVGKDLVDELVGELRGELSTHAESTERRARINRLVLQAFDS